MMIEPPTHLSACRIIQVASEFAPIAKAGGLGEVVVGLSRELIRLGHTVEIILPKYHWISTKGASLEIASLPVQEQGAVHENRVWSQEVEGCRLHMIEALHPARYFDRDALYGFPDDAARFIYFSLAALEYLKQRKHTIDILHLHDWHTALCAPLVRGPYASQLSVHKVVLTLHNLEYQGKCASWDLERANLDVNNPCLQGLKEVHAPKDFNLLKGGFLYADAIVAVSPTYAKEICTPEMGWGLDPTLRKLQGKLFGILNGIDSMLWNPANDPFLTSHYTANDSIQHVVAAKKEIQQVLQQRFQLPADARPWIGAVTRLVPQKGIELLQQALKETVVQGGVFLLLGSPSPSLQKELDQFKQAFQKTPGVLISYQYDEALAHEIYAASDFFIVPSLFEPCGLSQLISFRYGTIPIVRATGGLKDSVIDYEDPLTPSPQRNGIVFQDPSLQEVTHAIQRAFHLWKKDSATRHWLMHRAMQLNFSWEKPALEYLKLYRKKIH